MQTTDCDKISALRDDLKFAERESKENYRRWCRVTNERDEAERTKEKLARELQCARQEIGFKDDAIHRLEKQVRHACSFNASIDFSALQGENTRRRFGGRFDEIENGDVDREREMEEPNGRGFAKER